MIELDDQHRYWSIDPPKPKTELVGVTRSLIENNLIDNEYFTDLGRGRGKLVHFLAERLATKRPLTEGIHDTALGYLIGFRKFLDRFAPKINGAEVVLGDVIRILGGTVDLDVVMEGSNGVIDIKTGEPTPWHGLQLAPYAYLLDGKKWLDRARWGLYLNDRGGFRLKEYTDHKDLDFFFRAHELLLWRIQHGSFERPYGRRSNIRFDGDSITDSQTTEWGSDPNGYPSADDAGIDSGEIPF